MDILGDLERFFATNLYPLRVPLAIAAGSAMVALVWIGHRRGWLAAVRRHPLRSGLALVVILAVAAPPAWYFGSPLFLRTELREAAPVAVPAAPDPAPTGAGATGGGEPATPTGAAPATPPQPTRVGEFRGADDFHFGRGIARLIETEPDRYVLRFEDFSVRNGPDLFVYLSPEPDGYADDAINLGRLRATDGSFNVDVPAGVDVGAARSVIIWCREFGVLFAVAPLAG